MVCCVFVGKAPRNGLAQGHRLAADNVSGPDWMGDVPRDVSQPRGLDVHRHVRCKRV